MIAPLNYFLHAYGPAARPTLVLGWVFTAIAVAVCLLVAALLLMGIFHKRGDSHTRIDRSENGLPWVYAATGLSICVLFAMALYALLALNQVASPPAPPLLTITVTGYDWWWKVEYEGADATKIVVTANEIHIPTGVPVEVNLRSADVIHAFWVPLLAGKTQMIPGQTNQQWIEADAPGVYRGKCTQFCGLQHAHMDFEVVAQSRSDFDGWLAAQRMPAAKATDPLGRKGRDIFSKNCAACHAVRGSEASGTHGPDLTHLASRRLIGAGLLTNTPEHRMQWVAHVQELKPGAQMPDTALSPDDEAALKSYLETLQ